MRVSNHHGVKLSGSGCGGGTPPPRSAAGRDSHIPKLVGRLAVPAAERDAPGTAWGKMPQLRATRSHFRVAIWVQWGKLGA